MNIIDNNGISLEKIYDVCLKINKYNKIVSNTNSFFNDESKIFLYSTKFKDNDFEEESSGEAMEEGQAFISSTIELVENSSLKKHLNL